MRRRLFILAAACMLPGCATIGGGGNEIGRKYVVFFTKGSSSVDSPGNRVVTAAANVAKRHPDQTVIVAGYAAAHGNLNADEQISAARAEAVATALRADGVPAASISEHARPPSNEDPGVAARRVEIAFAPHT